MEDTQYRIADIDILGYGAACSQILAPWKAFAYRHDSPNAIGVHLLPLEQEQYGIKAVRFAADDISIIYNDDATAVTDASHKNIYFLPSVSAQGAEALLDRFFYTHAVQRQMLQLHCATIEDQGRGILFLGPSGIGKTTQAERWAQYRGSSIINGDIGFVQRTPQGYTAWGTPWHGSSPYCLNTSVPVKALVVLKQAPENRLRELTGFEKVREVSGSVFYPTWLENGMELCTDTLNHLLTDLPVYRLDNRADEAAVNLLAAELDRIT